MSNAQLKNEGQRIAALCPRSDASAAFTGLIAALEAAEVERDSTERDWADYFEGFDSTVGAPALTPALVVSLLRGPRPFGAMARAAK